MARSDGDGFEQNSFVNAISTPKGGTSPGSSEHAQEGQAISRGSTSTHSQADYLNWGRLGRRVRFCPQVVNALGYCVSFRAVQKCEEWFDVALDMRNRGLLNGCYIPSLLRRLHEFLWLNFSCSLQAAATVSLDGSNPAHIT